MWIFDFLFGRKRQKAFQPKRPLLGKLPVGQICRARHRPEGDWVNATLTLDVAGIQHRRAEVEAFVKAAHSADLEGAKYGVRLTPDPLNPYDPNAIKVIGEVPGRGEWHIGYLDRETAEDISQDLLAAGIPIAGDLYKIYVSAGGFIEIKVIVLAPPGNGEKARRKRRAANFPAPPTR